MTSKQLERRGGHRRHACFEGGLNGGEKLARMERRQRFVDGLALFELFWIPRAEPKNANWNLVLGPAEQSKIFGSHDRFRVHHPVVAQGFPECREQTSDEFRIVVGCRR